MALAVLRHRHGRGTSRQAIAGGDVKRLQTAKGVGKQAAEQMVVELRDKVGLCPVQLQKMVGRGAA